MAQRKPSRRARDEQESTNTRVRVNTLARARNTRLSAVRTIKTKNYVLETRPDSIRKPFPYAIIFSFLAIVAVAMYVLSLRVTLDSLTADISKMEREISAVVEDRNALEVRLNAKYDLTEIERIAKEEYGMVSKDSLTKKYISVSGEDEIELLLPTDPEEEAAEPEGEEEQLSADETPKEETPAA